MYDPVYDDFLVVRNYGKLSVKFLSGTSTVIEKVGLLVIFFVNSLNVAHMLNNKLLSVQLSAPWLLEALTLFRWISISRLMTSMMK